MRIKNAYPLAKKTRCMLFLLLSPELLLALLFLLFMPYFCLSQVDPQYDEVTVNLSVPGIGISDIPALIKNEKAYLPVSDVFTLLKIKNSLSARLDSISGFFIYPQDEYLIDGVNKLIIFQKKKIELKPDELIVTETGLYMKTDIFGEVFGLNCQFNVRILKVNLTTELELPSIRDMKMAQMRNNIKRLTGEVKTDTTYSRSYPFLKFGMADWGITSQQQNGISPITRLNLNLGSVVMGGEMNVGLINYDPTKHLESIQQTYLWRYANNDHEALRQVSIGKMMPQTISTLYGYLIGVQLTNTPTLYRRSFGTYTLSNVTEPGWMVELYVNNVMVDYVKADASGFYKFEVPLVYGVTELVVRMIGPWGEVRTRTEKANIPFNFVPSGKLEYTVNAGGVEGQPNTKLYRTNVNYGISRTMSVGGGYEYFSSPTLSNSLPYISSSVMLLKNILLAGEYTYGVRVKGSLNYHSKSNIQLDFNYTGYEKGQKAILYVANQAWGGAISVPLQGKHFSIYTRLSLDQMKYSTFNTTNASFLFSGFFYGVSSNITTSLNYTDPKHINTTSNLSLSFRLPGQVTLMPSALYDYGQHRFLSMLCNLQKPLFHNGFLNMSYNGDFIGKINSFEVGLRYDFSFMQTSLISRLSKRTNSFSQSANGSILFDGKNRYIGAAKTSMVGRSGLTFYAFLDLNGNGKMDANEPKVSGLNISINGGRIVKRENDSTIRVIDLIPYTSYLVELNGSNFQNISWKVKKTALNVYADPNQFKTIAIPVDIMSEAAGQVNLKSKRGTKGLGRVYVDFYRSDKTLFGQILTESDGYYSFMGLKPGDYIAKMDSSQLSSIRMTSSPAFKSFTVKQSKDGDFIEGIDFTLQSTYKDTTEIQIPKVDSTKIKIINYASNGVKEGVVVGAKNADIRVENNIPGVRYSQGFPANDKTDGKKLAAKPGELKVLNLKSKPIASLIRATDQYSIVADAEGQRCSIQFGEYTSEKDALADQRTITTTTGSPVIIVKEGEVYKLWIEGFNSRRDARAFLASLGKVEMPTNVDREVIAMNKVAAVSNADEKHIPISDKESKVGVIANPAGKNQFVDYTDSIANIYKFEPEGSKTRGYPVAAKQADNSNVSAKTDVKALQVNTKPTLSSSGAEIQRNQIAVASGYQFSVRVDGFIFDKSATAALRRISMETKQPIIISIKEGFYNLLIQGFASRREAKIFEDKLALMGFKGSIVRGN